MRRSRRGRFWHAGLLFLVYSCYYVYSDKVQSPTDGDEKVPLDLLPGGTHAKTSTAATPKDILEAAVVSTRISLTTTTNTPALTSNDTLATTEPTTPHVHPTWRPKRANCSPPAIEQFPKPLMGPGIRKHGGGLINRCPDWTRVN